VTFRTNFNPDDFRRKLEEAALESVKKQIEQRVRSSRCPVHGASASVSFSGTSVDRLNVRLSGCCDEGVAAAKATLPLKRSA
jgi:hypothetical protein